jgi:hypothetical protein
VNDSTTVVSVLSFGAGLILLYRLNLRLYRDHFSPLGLLIYSWFVPLWFRTMNLSELETDWTARSYIAVGLVSTILVATSLLPALRKGHDPELAVNREWFQRSVSTLDSVGARSAFACAFLVLFGLYLWTEFVTNPAGVAVLSALTGRLDQELAAYYNWGKIEGRTALTSVFLTMTSWLYPLSALLYLQFTRTKGFFSKSVLLAMCLLTPAFGLMKLSKTDVLTSWSALGLAMYYTYRFRDHHTSVRLPLIVKLRVAVMVVCLVTVPFWLTSVLRVGDQGTAAAGAILIDWIRFRFDEHTPLNTFLATVYTYTALCFENFNRFVNSYEGGANLGGSVFRPILSAFAQGRIADELMSQVDFNYVVEGAAIAGTFMTPVFAEGGWALLLTATLAYGVLLNSIYGRLRRRPSHANLLLYCNFAFCWMFLFFSNAFATLLFYTTAGAIVLIGWLFPTPAASAVAMRTPAFADLGQLHRKDRGWASDRQGHRRVDAPPQLRARVVPRSAQRVPSRRGPETAPVPGGE